MNAQLPVLHSTARGCIPYLNELLKKLSKELSPKDIEKCNHSFEPFFIANSTSQLDTYLTENSYYQILSDDEDFFLAVGCATTSKEYLFLGSHTINLLTLLFSAYSSNEIRSDNFSFLSPTGVPLSPSQAANNIRDLLNNKVSQILHEAFHINISIFNQLSISKQEGEPVTGNLGFYPDDEDLSSLCSWTIRNRNDIILEENSLRLIGKLIIGSPPPHGLLFKLGESHPICVGCIPKSELVKIPLLVKINGNLDWELVCFRQPILHYIHGAFHFPSILTSRKISHSNRKRITSFLNEIFSFSTDSEQISKLAKTISYISRQKHGAAAVVANWNNEECQTRLNLLLESKKALPICMDTMGTNVDTLTHAAKMDGAVIIDVVSGKVVAVATILDGQTAAKASGDPSRGSRFNSIKTFVNSISEPIAAFVFSSDGGMDCLKN